MILGHAFYLPFLPSLKHSYQSNSTVFFSSCFVVFSEQTVFLHAIPSSGRCSHRSRQSFLSSRMYEYADPVRAAGGIRLSSANCTSKLSAFIFTSSVLNLYCFGVSPFPNVFVT